MKKTLKLLAASALISVSAGVLTGCIVETRHPYHHHYYRTAEIRVR